ncbi:MAG TPA: cytochrome c oxidase subunit II [Acidobacteriaceae bacterium]
MGTVQNGTAVKMAGESSRGAKTPAGGCRIVGRFALAGMLLAPLLSAGLAFADGPRSTPSMFSPVSTPASDEFELSMFVLGITGGIFVVVGSLLVYVVWKFRQRGEDDSEPAQVYGSTQIELAWTVIPVIIVVVLFLTTARLIFAIQDNPRPPGSLDVTVVGHQFWWEFRYPKYGIVTANELHVPLSDPNHPTPTYLKLLSADVIHSFWVPQLAGKTDAIPNHENEMWVDPHAPGMYVGQCGQFCGTQHAKMLLRVYVDTPQQFAAWVSNQQLPGPSSGDVAAGKQVFETQSCMNCHAVKGSVANGHFGPDLTHFGGRDTLGSGAVPNTRENLKAWIRDPSDLKPGALMPAMQLDETQLDQVTAYLASLK